MTIENTVSPDAETLNPAPEVIETPELITPDAEGQEPTVEPPPELSDADKEIKALKRRIDRMTSQKYQLQDDLQTARSRPIEQQSQPQEPQQYTQQRYDSDVQSAARELNRGQSLNQKLDTVEAAVRKTVGKPAYDDFYEDLKSAGESAAVLLETALELDDSEKVMTHFVNDREEFDKVLQMKPRQQAIYMGQLSARLTTPSRINTAPKPLTPINSRGTTRPNAANQSDEDMVRAIRNTR